LGGGSSEALGINERHQIVGAANYPNSNWYRAVTWNYGGPQDLGTLGGPAAEALGINNLDQMVGAALDASNISHAALWQRGRITSLASAGDQGSTALAINDLGEVVGYGYLPGPADSHAVLFLQGQEVDLGTVDGDSESQANAINDAGTVVGGSGIVDHPFHAFIWRDGTISDLNSQIPPGSGWYLIDATGINAFGQIAGYGLVNGELHGFLLTPAGESHDPYAEATAPQAAAVQAAFATLPADERNQVNWNRPSLSVS
jgi:probable HAF family extracellular repeat protein